VQGAGQPTSKTAPKKGKKMILKEREKIMLLQRKEKRIMWKTWLA
jgi:hypothetical protein